MPLIISVTHSFHPFLSISLLSGTTNCSKVALYFPGTSPGISSLLKEAWLLLAENGFWILGVFNATVSSHLLLGVLSLNRKS